MSSCGIWEGDVYVCVCGGGEGLQTTTLYSDTKARSLVAMKGWLQWVNKEWV